MKKFSHVGIPTSIKQQDEIFVEDAGLYVTDFSQSDNHIEWLRFAEGSGMPEILKTTAHVAWEVDDLEVAMQGHTILLEPFSPNPDLKVAFIMDGAAPIELMQVLN